MVLFNRYRYYLPGFQLSSWTTPMLSLGTDYIIHQFLGESTSPSLVGYSLTG